MTRQLETELADIRILMAQLLGEVAALRQERLPASFESIEALLGAIHEVFGDAPVAAAWILEGATEGDPDSLRLRNAILHVAGTRPTVAKLSRLLSRSVGMFGNLRLTLKQRHTREGNLFSVTDVSKSVTTRTAFARKL